MKIGIDLREGLRKEKAGKGFYVARVWQEIVQQKELELVAYCEDGQTVEQRPSRGEVVCFPASGRWHIQVAQAVRRAGVELFFAPTSFIVPALLERGRSVVVVHDMVAFRQDEQHSFKARWIERLLLGRVMGRAKTIVTPSAQTASELRKCYGEGRLIQHLPLGPSLMGVVPAAWKTVAERYHLPDQFVLFVGSLVPRKNPLRMIEAYLRLPEALQAAYPLVVVGRVRWGDELFRRQLEELLKSPHVRWLGYVERDEDVASLYERASVLFFPSLYEGFGFMVLDAMMLGCPVLTSERSAMAEVCGQAAEYVDPMKIEDMTKRLECLLGQPDRRQVLKEAGKLQAAQFSWQKHVDGLIQLFRR